MFKKFLSQYKNVLIGTIISVLMSAIIVPLALWGMRAAIKDANHPLAQEVRMGFKKVDNDMSMFNERIVKVELNQHTQDEKVNKLASYENNVLRVEVKDNAQSKVSKADFWNREKEIDERLDADEVGKEVAKQHSRK